ncbi:unnamed protein product [Rotaria sp. Silwood1]|nr:unnamed protein product [Rotaria sp. Silwood1]CAF1625082.1 unnamed protein product [Rotaria sp. Silwood1]CAF3759836.1 unnamed protein product [Rotaria sp. Silwood1]CAF4952595.1 unnamed protein product [Rotaria sp. Silwood1]CAF4976433.1 unnamed protein product [Rotaria sp. Silwood1]
MKEAWNLQLPDIIIFVMSRAEDDDVSVQLREMIRKDLVYAAIRANAWLVTSGKNVGVAKEVGEGLRYYRDYIEKHKYNLPCIGSTSWNSIAGYAQREKKTKNLPESASSSRRHLAYSHDRSSAEHTIQIHGNDHCKENREFNLDPNHTHFLLFDGDVKNGDFVLHLLEHVEWRWSIKNSNDEAEESPIPIVMVLVESDTQLNTTKVKVVKPGIPVVLLKDSCEILEMCKHPVTVLKISSNRHDRNFEDAILQSLSNGKQQFYLVNQRHFFYFVTARRNTEISNQQHKLANELILAIAWNRFDYAREYLLTDTTRPNYTERDLHRALLNALDHGHIDFIELLLDFGASFKNLTPEDLEKLYDQPSYNPLPITDEQKPLDKNQYYTDYLKRIGTTPLNLLLGAYIYRYATQLKINTDMQEQYHKHANQLEDIAVSIIDMSYEYDKCFTLSLLKHSVDAFNHMTLLELAETVECKSFLASRCVQRHLQKICGVILFNYFPLNIYGERRSGYEGLAMPTFEMILHVCTWSLICEEIRQV